jgi:hypothetical protein
MVFIINEEGSSMLRIKYYMKRFGIALAGGVVMATALFNPLQANAFDPSPWTHLLLPAPIGYTPNLSTLCPDGSNTCVDDSLSQFNTLLSPLVANCDHNLLFPFFYTKVTGAYRTAINDPNYLVDNANFNRLDTVFAHYYFNQRQAWVNHDLANVSIGWQEAFKAADDKSVSSLGDVLLSLNAHIIHDLSYTMDEAGLTHPDGTSIKPDYDKINELIFDNQNAILNEAGRRFDPTLSPTNPDTGLISYQVIAGMREQAWRFAEQLKVAEANPNPVLAAAQVQTIRASIDAETEANAAAIKTTFAATPQQTATRDAYCTLHHNDT